MFIRPVALSLRFLATESCGPCYALAGTSGIPLLLLMQVLILFAGLSTCDPGNILDTVKVAKQQRVRVSVVGLAAEVHICRVITEVSIILLLQ